MFYYLNMQVSENTIDNILKYKNYRLIILSKVFPNSYMNFSFVETIGNGSCFFECVGKCFPEFNKIVKYNNTTQIIRICVAKKIYEYNENTQKVIQYWKEMWKMAKESNDEQLMKEYYQVKDIENIPDCQKLSDIHLEKIVSFILTNNFWAEEFSIRTICEELNLCFIIVDEISKKIQPSIYYKLNKYTNYIIVYLDSCSHYTLLSYKNILRFKNENLPPFINNNLND